MLLWTGEFQMVVYWKEVNLKSSEVKRSQMLEKSSLNLPALEPSLGRSVLTPYVFIGDDSFALQPNFMKPFSQKNLDLFTRICNYRFWHGRQISENVFGIITYRWRVYRSPSSLHPQKVRELTMPPGFCDTYDLTT